MHPTMLAALRLARPHQARSATVSGPPAANPRAASSATYVVNQGDTFSSICRAMRVEPDALLRANPEKKTMRLGTGQTVFAELEAGERLLLPVPGRSASSLAGPGPMSGGKSGDTFVAMRALGPSYKLQKCGTTWPTIQAGAVLDADKIIGVTSGDFPGCLLAFVGNEKAARGPQTYLIGLMLLPGTWGVTPGTPDAKGAPCPPGMHRDESSVCVKDKPLLQMGSKRAGAVGAPGDARPRYITTRQLQPSSRCPGWGPLMAGQKLSNGTYEITSGPFAGYLFASAGESGGLVDVYYGGALLPPGSWKKIYTSVGKQKMPTSLGEPGALGDVCNALDDDFDVVACAQQVAYSGGGGIAMQPPSASGGPGGSFFQPPVASGGPGKIIQSNTGDSLPGSLVCGSNEHLVIDAPPFCECDQGYYRDANGDCVIDSGGGAGAESGGVENIGCTTSGGTWKGYECQCPSNLVFDPSKKMCVDAKGTPGTKPTPTGPVAPGGGGDPVPGDVRKNAPNEMTAPSSTLKTVGIVLAGAAVVAAGVGGIFYAKEKGLLGGAPKRASNPVTNWDFKIDTALSWEGRFPPAGPGDYHVVIQGPNGRKHNVLVSRRYTAPDAEEAAEIALDAIAERNNDEPGNWRVTSVKAL